MAKAKKSDFEKYMERGYSLHQACALSGVTVDEARKLIAEHNSDYEDWELIRQHGTRKIARALNVLDSLMGSDDEAIALGAVRTLIQIMKPIKDKCLVKIEAEDEAEDLWTLAQKNRSKN